MKAKAKKLGPSILQRWKHNPAAFITEVLNDPDTGKPFQLLDAERRFLELSLPPMMTAN